MTANRDTHFDPIRFRHHLHRYPELSLNEQKTASEITDQLLKFGLTPKTNIGGHGLLVEIKSRNPGPTTLLRADFDALPISETAQHDHASRHHGCMHACGHDGHTVSLLTVANRLSQHPPASGRVILLFQPAEEIGQGAKMMLKDPRMQDLQPDYVFAYHNLPGHPLGSVVIKSGVFACASIGVKITLTGKTSHAAKPEKGRSPAPAVARIMDYLHQMPEAFEEAFSLVTLVHVKVGNEGFGTAPGRADVMATIRSDDNYALEHMKKSLQNFAKKQAESYQLGMNIDWIEPFSATVNDPIATDMVIKTANSLNYPVITPTEPMRWSEDMGEFLQQAPGALFCLGSGVDHPELHNPDYDFPDALIGRASRLFLTLIKQLHG
ncbi:amidohydrolase [Photobacterium lipolyticum]|uniref:Amidohydrolase n=1 Tax=Photobacterium lipolyticum TaxID=266810 RepID=A0A2T3MZ23_9GAMM|nr:amidohydrolase [Photobacterium lipolyticum]PSW05198.1 amidohydrolase [Photobacterium lipolyticum]